MRVLLAETFFDSLLKLPAGERDRAIKSVQQLKKDPKHPSLKLHPVKESKGSFFTARISRDARLVVHLHKDEILVCFGAKHDDAYDYARNRYIKKAQDGSEIVSVVEQTETSQIYQPAFAPPESLDKDFPSNIQNQDNSDTQNLDDETELFAEFSDETILRCGVNNEALGSIRSIKSEQQLFLLENQVSSILHDNLVALYLGEGIRIRTYKETQSLQEDVKYVEYEGTEEILAALKKPWERWLVFLSGAQNKL